MFILNKSGYKVRLSKINEKLKLMVAPAGVLYGIPYILLDGTKYYVFDAEKTNGPMGVYTYKQDFPMRRTMFPFPSTLFRSSIWLSTQNPYLLNPVRLKWKQ